MLLYTYAYNRIADVSTYSNVQMLSISLIEPYSARRCRKNIRRDKSRKISLGEAFDLWTLSFFSYLPSKVVPDLSGKIPNFEGELHQKDSFLERTAAT